MGCKSSELRGQHIVLAANRSPAMLESLSNRFFKAADALNDLWDRALVKFGAHLADEGRVIGNSPIQCSDLSLERLNGVGPFIGSDWTGGLESTATTIWAG